MKNGASHPVASSPTLRILFGFGPSPPLFCPCGTTHSSISQPISKVYDYRIHHVPCERQQQQPRRGPQCSRTSHVRLGHLCVLHVLWSVARKVLFGTGTRGNLSVGVVLFGQHFGGSGMGDRIERNRKKGSTTAIQPISWREESQQQHHWKRFEPSVAGTE